MTDKKKISFLLKDEDNRIQDGSDDSKTAVMKAVREQTQTEQEKRRKEQEKEKQRYLYSLEMWVRQKNFRLNVK